MSTHAAISTPRCCVVQTGSIQPRNALTVELTDITSLLLMSWWAKPNVHSNAANPVKIFYSRTKLSSCFYWNSTITSDKLLKT